MPQNGKENNMNNEVTPYTEVRPPQPQQTTEMVNVSQLMDSCICLVIKRNWIPMIKTVPTSKVSVFKEGAVPMSQGDVILDKPGESMFHVQKNLFDSQILKELVGLEVKLDDYIASRCLPSFFRRALWLLPVDLFPEVEERFVRHLEKREKLIDQFCEEYEAEIEKAKLLLKEHFNPADYLSPTEVRSRFGFQWQYVQFGVSAKLERLNKAVFEREQQKAAAEWKEAMEEIKALMRANMKELVDHMVDRLTPSPDGKKKIFKRTMLDNINDFLGSFDPRNLSGDAQLKELVDQAKKMTSGISPDTLRTNDNLRSAMQSGFEQIKVKLDTMVTEAPIRKIRFAQESEPSVQ